MKRFNAQDVDTQGDSAAKEVDDPELKKHGELLEVVKEFCRQDRDLTNYLFSREIGGEEKLIEAINPSGSRTFKKGLYFVSFTDSAVKIKKFMQAPKNYTYTEFLNLIQEALGPETSLTKWEDCFGVAPAQTAAKESVEEPKQSTEELKQSTKEPKENVQKPEENTRKLKEKDRETERKEDTGEEERDKRGTEASVKGDAEPDGADQPAGGGSGGTAQEGETKLREHLGTVQTPEDILREDRETGSIAGGHHQVGEGTEAEHTGSDQVGGADGSLGEGNLESDRQSADWPDEWKPQEEQAQEGFAPARLSEENAADPYLEVVMRMNASIDRIKKYIEAHNWHEMESDLVLMKLYLEEAKEIEERWRECS